MVAALSFTHADHVQSARTNGPRLWPSPLPCVRPGNATTQASTTVGVAAACCGGGPGDASACACTGLGLPPAAVMVRAISGRLADAAAATAAPAPDAVGMGEVGSERAVARERMITPTGSDWSTENWCSTAGSTSPAAPAASVRPPGPAPDE